MSLRLRPGAGGFVLGVGTTRKTKMKVRIC